MRTKWEGFFCVHNNNSNAPYIHMHTIFRTLFFVREKSFDWKKTKENDTKWHIAINNSGYLEKIIYFEDDGGLLKSINVGLFTTLSSILDYWFFNFACSIFENAYLCKAPQDFENPTVKLIKYIHSCYLRGGYWRGDDATNR
jgi:hypothetical protein